MKKLLIISMTALLFSSCKTDSGWTDSQKEKAKKSCLDGMEGKTTNAISKKYCDCILEQVMKKYKNYADLDRRSTEEEGRKMGMNCISELLPQVPSK